MKIIKLFDLYIRKYNTILRKAHVYDIYQEQHRQQNRGEYLDNR